MNRSKVNSPAGGPQFTFAVRSSSLGASLEASAAAISHVIPSVIRTMTAMSASIRDHEHMTDFLLRLLNIFNSLGMSNIRPAVEQQGTKTEGGGKFTLCDTSLIYLCSAMFLYWCSAYFMFTMITFLPIKLLELFMKLVAFKMMFFTQAKSI